MSKLSRSENRAKWLAIVSDYEDSGMKQDEYCAFKGIKKSTLHYWLRRSRMEDSSLPSPSSPFVLIRPEEENELRIAYRGLDIFIPLSADPSLVRRFVNGLTKR